MKRSELVPTKSDPEEQFIDVHPAEVKALMVGDDTGVLVEKQTVMLEKEDRTVSFMISTTSPRK